MDPKWKGKDTMQDRLEARIKKDLGLKIKKWMKVFFLGGGIIKSGYRWFDEIN